LNDDRPLTVNNLTVNEGSTFAVVSVNGEAGQYVKLALAANTATSGVDYTNTMEYWNGAAWVPYAANSFVQIPVAETTLLVRIAITNDTSADNGETFTLTATNTGGINNVISTGKQGIVTIKDDGTGAVFVADDPATLNVDESAPDHDIAPTVTAPTTPVVLAEIAAPYRTTTALSL
jgi:hypothetical protein